MTGRRPRVFSGIQPSGDMHLGNYLGAVKRWVDGQAAKENYFCIVDLHALTVPQDAETLRGQTRSVATFLLAAGLDPDQCTLFVQSHVSAHAEACWLLNCITPLGWLQRMTQYKDRAARQESVGTGLLDYPVLMAADILLYDADEVLVGEDQRQHVELARDIADRFNRVYGDLFVLPAAIIPDAGARVMGLDDPTVKMSKSRAHVRDHAIRVLDEPDDIRRAIMRAVTDSGNDIRFSEDPARAGVTNLLGIYRAITGKTTEAVEADFAGARGYGELKEAVAEVVVAELTPIRERYAVLTQDPGQLDRRLAHGAERARAIADSKVTEMRRRMGLLRPA
jgi:tryptophanyl-tRNA synthetase